MTPPPFQQKPTDPFQDKHKADTRAAEKAAREAYQKSITQSAQDRAKAKADLDKADPNRDIGVPYRKHFWRPGY